MVIGLTVYLALSLLAALVIFPALILGSRADRCNDLRLAASGPGNECLSGSVESATPLRAGGLTRGRSLTEH